MQSVEVFLTFLHPCFTASNSCRKRPHYRKNAGFSQVDDSPRKTFCQNISAANCQTAMPETSADGLPAALAPPDCGRLAGLRWRITPCKSCLAKDLSPTFRCCDYEPLLVVNCLLAAGFVDL
jgi:hypothetical protein